MKDNIFAVVAEAKILDAIKLPTENKKDPPNILGSLTYIISRIYSLSIPVIS